MAPRSAVAVISIALSNNTLSISTANVDLLGSMTLSGR